MLIKMMASQIPDYWNIINYAALQVNKPSKSAMFSRNLLKNLLSEKYQCWAVLDNEQNIKAVCITRIFTALGEIPVLFIDTVYGFSPTTKEEKSEWIEAMKKFAEGIGCESVTTLTSNELASNAAQKAGMVHTHDVYTYQLGGISDGR